MSGLLGLSRHFVALGFEAVESWAGGRGGLLVEILRFQQLRGMMSWGHWDHHDREHEQQHVDPQEQLEEDESIHPKIISLLSPVEHVLVVVQTNRIILQHLTTQPVVISLSFSDVEHDLFWADGADQGEKRVVNAASLRVADV